MDDVGRLAEELDEALLHGVELKVLVSDGLVVEIDAVHGDVVDDSLRGSQLLGNVCLSLFLQVLIEPLAPSQLMTLHELPVMGTAVVGSQEQQVVLVAHLSVEGRQQTSDILVKLQICLVGMLAAGAPLMTNGIGLGIAHAEHVGGAVMSHVLALQSGNSHIGDEVSAEGIEGNILARIFQLLVLGHLCIHLFDIVGQLLHIVGAGDKAACLVVHPVGGIGTSSCRQDGSTVLEADTDDL